MIWANPGEAKCCKERTDLRAENERLRAELETAIDLLCGARSGHIGGSQPDCEWDSRKERLLKDFAALATEQKGPAGERGQVGWMGGEHDR